MTINKKIAPDRSAANRIWIELEKPENAKRAHEVCKLANNVLHRLFPSSAKLFFFDEKKKQFCYGDDGGYLEMPDRGVWLNMDYAGRSLVDARTEGEHTHG